MTTEGQPVTEAGRAMLLGRPVNGRVHAAILAIEAEAHAAGLAQGRAEGLDVERIREDEATWGLRCTGCGTVHSGGSGHRPGDAGDRPCCPDCEHVSYFLAPTPPTEEPGA